MLLTVKNLKTESKFQLLARVKFSVAYHEINFCPQKDTPLFVAGSFIW